MSYITVFKKGSKKSNKRITTKEKEEKSVESNELV